MKAFLSLILVVFIFADCQSQGKKLGLRLEVGETYKQVTNSKVNIIQDLNGQEMEMTMVVGGSMSFLTKSADKNSYKMDATFEELKMSMEMPQGSVEFSSEKNDPNDVLSNVLGAMKSKAFEVVMSKTGKVEEVNNVEAVWESAIDQFGDLPALQKEQIRAQIMKAYGAEALRGNIEMVTAIYSNKAVKQGDKWTVETALESGMSAKVVTEYEYAGLTSEYALIKGNSTLETADKDAYIETNGMPLKYDLKGTMQSEIKVDKKTGWIIEAKIEQDIKGDTYIKANPQMADGLKIPMIMKSEMEVSN